jgi:glycopeptide antibiotics resistance protein
MSAYLMPIKVAVLLFPFLALAISSIFFVRQYRKYGRFILSRALILYSFVFYLLCAYFLVILPLPSIQEVAQMNGPRMEWHLGASWQHFLQQTVLQLNDSSTYLPALKQNVLLEPLFNLLLTVPFGVYMRYYFKLSFPKTVLATFGLSLFFELTQLTGLYFIYPRSYRLFDVNDLFVNSLGGALGYFVAPIFTFLLPTREEIDAASYATDTRITFTRRLVAFLIDWGILDVIRWGIGRWLLFGLNNRVADFTDDYWYFVVEVLVYFVLLSYLFKGQTIGKKLVRIRVMEENHSRVRLSALFKRYALVYLIYIGASRVNDLFTPFLQTSHHLLLPVSLLIILIFSILQLGFYCNILWSVMKKQPRYFYEKRTKTYLISTIERNKVGH